MRESLDRSDIESPAVYSVPFPVLSHDVDPGGHLRIDALAGLLHETAWRHAERSGMGFRALQQIGLLWVVSRFQLRIKHPAQRGEMIMVRTWPRDMNRLYAFREFQVLDGNDDIIATATGMWIIIDFETRKPVNLKRFRNHFTFHDRTTIQPAVPRLSSPETFQYQANQTVGWLDLDFNHHVNNLNYIRWVLQLLPPAVPASHFITDLIVNYSGEARLGDQLMTSVAKSETDPLVYVGEISNLGQGRILARVRIQLHPDSRKE